MLDEHAADRLLSLPPIQGSYFKRYGVALLAMTSALALRAVFQPFLGDSMHYVSISAATVFAAWYCGLWPAILATVAGTVAANALFVPPYDLLGPITQQAIIGEILFLAFCGAIIALGESGRRAVLRLGHVHEVLLRSRMHLKFRVRERTAELRQMNQSLRDLSARLLRVQDDERRRIARDLHDSTGQALTALKLELAGIEREVAAQNPELALRLAASIADARQISDELRTISYLLHPPLLDELGLGSALRWYAEGFEKRSGIKVHLELEHPGRLAPEMEVTLFRVAQESLINVHRHSGSASATIRLSATGGRIVLQVEDQGRGIPPEQLAAIASGATPGVGLRGMRERVQDFGGELEISSSQRGTEVKAAIPLEAAQRFNVAVADEAAIPGSMGAKKASASGLMARRAGAN
jgi:signal transduction histidine kinase